MMFAPSYQVCSVGFTPDGKYLAAGVEDKQIGVCPHVYFPLQRGYTTS